MASGMYNRGSTNLIKSLDWTSSDLRMLLVTSSYSPDKDHNTVSQITNELSGGNYARVSLSGRTATQDDSTDRAVADATDAVFTALQAVAGTPKYAIVYYEGGGTDATRELVCFIDLGVADTPNGTDYTIVFSVSGVAYLQD